MPHSPCRPTIHPRIGRNRIRASPHYIFATLTKHSSPLFDTSCPQPQVMEDILQQLVGNTTTLVVFLAHVMVGSCNIRSALPSYICADTMEPFGTQLKDRNQRTQDPFWAHSHHPLEREASGTGPRVFVPAILDRLCRLTSMQIGATGTQGPKPGYQGNTWGTQGPLSYFWLT